MNFLYLRFQLGNLHLRLGNIVALLPHFGLKRLARLLRRLGWFWALDSSLDAFLAARFGGVLQALNGHCHVHFHFLERGRLTDRLASRPIILSREIRDHRLVHLHEPNDVLGELYHVLDLDAILTIAI
jgi:hypothetical protein